jgi:hypothetical protein
VCGVRVKIRIRMGRQKRGFRELGSSVISYLVDDGGVAFEERAGS